MTSSHPQNGPSGHLSTPQPQSQLQSQPADGQPHHPEAPPPPPSGRASGKTPFQTNHVDGATGAALKEPAPPTNLPPSPPKPAHSVQPSAPPADGIPPQRDVDKNRDKNSLVHNWLNNTDRSPPQPSHDGTAEYVAPPAEEADEEAPAEAAPAEEALAEAPAEEAPAEVASFSAVATAADTVTAVDPPAVDPLAIHPHAVDPPAGNGLSGDFASPDVAMLGQDNIAHGFGQSLPADPYGGTLTGSWQLSEPFTFNYMYQAGFDPSYGNGNDMSDDDDAASLDQPELDGTGFDRMARLEFADTYVAITTNTTIIGRDQAVYRRALKNKKRAETKGDPSGAVPQKRGRYSRSYVSQEGGALGPESDGEGKSRSSKRRKTLDNGRDAFSPRAGTPAADDLSATPQVIRSRQYMDHTPGAVPVDTNVLRPSADHVARIDIHGAGPDIIETSKGISRDHLKIQYDEEHRVWKAIAIGRNGFFCDEKLYHKDQVVTLRSGSHLQIQAVGFIFTISGVEEGRLGNEDYYEGGKKMSLDFSDSRAESHMRDTDDEDSLPASNPKSPVMLDTDDSDESDDKAEKTAVPKPAAVNGGAPKAQPEEHIRPTIESDPVKEAPQSLGPDAPQSMVPPKKRGPGRPPKNGVMSKREERELKKKREEEDKRNNPPQEPGEPRIKRKVGRPRKHPRPEDDGDQPEKRKYKPRKLKNEDGEDEEDPEGDKADKQKRQQKPKTPPLEMGNKEDWPEEKLQKPNKNYQMLIDEVLTANPEGLTLKQIYKRIAKLYPYYHFCVDTKGWESSVRHNLIGSLCFQKNQETHLWKRVQGIPLESGKKRKPSDTAAEARPPPVFNGNFSASHGYQQPPHPQQHPNQHVVPAGNVPQMNGMARYQPGGRGHPAPMPNPPHPSIPTNQQGASRSFPQQPPQHQQLQQPPPAVTVPQASTYAATVGPQRPQHPGSQQHPYNPAFNQRAQQAPLAHGTAPGSHQIQNHAQNSLPGRPSQGFPPTSQRGPVIGHAGTPQQNQRAPSLPHPPQPVPVAGPPVVLGPAVEPSLRDFLGKFMGEVVKQLQGRVRRPQAVAVSVINRGLGLTDISLAPEHENFEKAIINIFHTHKLTYSKPKATSASAAATEPPRPLAASTAPTTNRNGNVALSASGSTQAPPSPMPTTSTSAPDGSAPSGLNTIASASNGSGTTASQLSGTQTATASAQDGNTVTESPVPGRNDLSTSGPALAGAAAASTAPGLAQHTSKAVGVGNPAVSSTGAQATSVPAANSPVASRSSATPAPAPGTPAPNVDSVQFLDPKLVEVVKQFKELSHTVLKPQLGALLAEILVMSAVNRVLGLTNETIVPPTTHNTKLGLTQAEDALINSLRPRVDNYIRSKQAPSTVHSSAPATPTPSHVQGATSATPLPLPASSH
jgi:hypothetical protein